MSRQEGDDNVKQDFTVCCVALDSRVLGECVEKVLGEGEGQHRRGRASRAQHPQGL